MVKDNFNLLFCDMAGAAKGGAKTASKNNPASRRAAKKMLFNGVTVKDVRVIGFEQVMADGSVVKLASFTGMARADNDELLVDAQGVPYNWKYAKPEA